MKKSVAVIGAGVAGITMVKACLEQNLDVVAYELGDTVGGLWCYREDTSPENERSVVNGCTHMNSSKEVSAISDFPPPDHYPNYMRHNLVQNYFESYAERFDLKKHVKFNHKVLKARENKNYGTGNVKRWTVEVMDTNTSVVSGAEFDAVAICAGQCNKPFRPSINGLEKFKGEVLHSASYRTPEKFKGKRVAVIGIGNSGADIGVDIAPVASEVFISSRKGTWIFGRPGAGGLPNDLKIFSRALMQTAQYFPKYLFNKYLLRGINAMLDHRVYGIEPKHGPLENTPTLNDELPHKILTGDIKLKKGVLEVLEDGIHFIGDEKRTALDVIVLGTGYVPALPFLDIAEEEFWTDSSLNLFKCIFPPDHGDGTLGFIGYSIPLGGVFPFVELQGRFFAAVIAGKANLPTIEEMKNDIRNKDEFNRKTYAPGERQIWYTDFIPYMDDLASRIGAKPDLISMLFKDPALWYNCFFGPITGYQYRLQGPHAWSGAREAIMTYYDRVLKPFQF